MGWTLSLGDFNALLEIFSLAGRVLEVRSYSYIMYSHGKGKIDGTG